MFNFNSSKDTSFQFHKCPNPNPNNDQVPYNIDQIADSLYYDVCDYLVSEENSEENILLQNNIGSHDNVKDYFDESSSSIHLAHTQVRRKIKKYKSQEEFRFVFRTKSAIEIMDDGFKWRKYGKKMVKSSPNPRNYFKCSVGGCNVKKRVEREKDDPKYVMTTYEGTHNHIA